MNVKQSHFRYEAFTNSSLAIFDKVPVLKQLCHLTHKIYSPVLLWMKTGFSLNLKQVVISTWICVIPISVQSLSSSKEDCLMLSKRKRRA